MHTGSPEGKRPLGKPRGRWDNIKMDLQKYGEGGVDWITVAEYKETWRAPVNPVINHGVPQNEENLLSG